MNALTVAVCRYSLPFRHPFVTAAGTLVCREGYLVRVTAADGTYGFGEAAPLPGHGGERLDETLPALTALAAALGPALAAGEVAWPHEPAALRSLARWLAQVGPAAPAARAGIDLALADLAARRAGLPLARWWRTDARRAVAVNATIGAVAPGEAADQAGALVEAGFRTIKVKVGTDGATDLARVAAVRWAVGPEVALRADANGAWQEDQARVVLRGLAPYDLEYVEQPVPADEIAALARLRRESAVLIAADESLALPGGPERVLEAEAADVFVLKPALIGGPSCAWELAESATRRGVACVVTSALESAVGRLGALHLAAALPQPQPVHDYACGLATGDLLAADLAATPVVGHGTMAIPPRSGIGVEPDGSFVPV